MAQDGTIGPVARASFNGGGQGGTGPHGGAVPGEPEARKPRPRLDEVVLTEPGRAALSLLRQRILERTRRELELPRGAAPAFVAPTSQHRADLFVGRLLSDQNMLASRRRETWPAERVDAALETAMTDGTEETLQVLHELGELDDASWGLVCSVLDEFHSKVMRARGEDPTADE